MRFAIARFVSRSGRAPWSIRAALIVVGSAVLISAMLGCKPAVVDLKPSFGTRTVADKTYAWDGPISALTLPLATGGDSPLSYRLTPAVPGLRFNTATRVLSGTPDKVDTHAMVYRVTDKDGDSATLRFTITIPEDHGDSKSTATPVQIGAGAISGQVEEPSDVDYFKFTVTESESGTLIAATDPDNRGHTDTVVSIEGVSGHVNNNPSWLDGVADVSPGTYYLKVRAKGATTGAYELAVWLIGSGNDSFDIDVRYVGIPPTKAQRALFDEAAAFWSGAITGDLPDMPVLSSGWTCVESDPLFGSTIDDLTIQVVLAPIDGLDGTLAQAAWCARRPAASGDLPSIGILVVDEEDIGPRKTAGELKTIIIHEMAHVLGFGTLWREFGFLENPSVVWSTDSPPEEVAGQMTHFDGPVAIAEFDMLDTTDSFTGIPVPVENDTGEYNPGGLDAHWRESVFGAESMTPSLDSGVPIPVSEVTLASLEDLGYVVNYTAADFYSLPAPGIVGEPGEPRPKIDLHDDIWRGPKRVMEIPTAIGGRGSR